MTFDAAPKAITAIILAGGRSNRFGADKASAMLGGRPLLQWAVDAVGEVCGRIIVVTARGQALPQLDSQAQLAVTADRMPGLGPLAALATGLACASTELCFATSCDAPLLQPALVVLLASIADGFDVVCPEVAERLQPLAAVYRTATCRPVFERCVDAGSLKMTAAFGDLRVRRVAERELSTADPALESFVNANTLAVLHELEARLAPPGA